MWQKTDHPISRFRQYMMAQGWWSMEEDAALQKSLKKDVYSAANSHKFIPFLGFDSARHCRKEEEAIY